MYFNELQMNEYDKRSVPEGEYKTSGHFDLLTSYILSLRDFEAGQCRISCILATLFWLPSCKKLGYLQDL